VRCRRFANGRERRQREMARWNEPHNEAQTLEDIRELLLIIASELTSFDTLGRTEVRGAFLDFLRRRRVPEGVTNEA
jgi:hypothetical protein